MFDWVSVSWALQDWLCRKAQLMIVLDHFRCKSRFAFIDNYKYNSNYKNTTPLRLVTIFIAVDVRTRLFFTALALAFTAAAAATVAVAIRVGLP